MVLKRIVQAVVGLLLLVVAGLLVSRWWPASTAQQQARAALEAPGDWPGRNAWPLLATLEHTGLETAEREAMVDAHVARFAAWAQATAAQRHGNLEAPASTDDSPGLPAPAQAPLARLEYCHAGGMDTCLDHVRANADAVAADVSARGEVIAAIAGLADYQHARSPYQPDVAMPLPAGLSRLFTPLAAHALAHVQGNSGLALDGLCRDMGSARMLASHSDSLVVTMVGARWLQANGQLLAAMLAQLPAGTALPASCSVALQPLATEAVSLCRPLRGEYAMAAATFGHSHAQAMAHSPGASWLFDLDKTLNRQAEGLGAACQAPLQARITQDLPVAWEAVPSGPRSLLHISCLTNYAGCVLSGIAAPAYDKYILRMQDVAASQRLLGAWLWLRGQPAGAEVTQQLAQLPDGLHSEHRPVLLSADGRALEVARYERARGADGVSQPPLRLPLPATLQR